MTSDPASLSPSKDIPDAAEDASYPGHQPYAKVPAPRPRGSYIGRLWACEGDREVLVLANVMVGVFLVFVGLALIHHFSLWPTLSDTGKIAGLVALITAVLAIPQLVLFHRHCAHCQHPG